MPVSLPLGDHPSGSGGGPSRGPPESLTAKLETTLMVTRKNFGLSYQGNMPCFVGATEWLNSETLTPADLRGRVVLVDFWTFTCINWIRTAPYRSAWDERYREHGLTVIGVHTPEFPFERDVDSGRHRGRGVEAAADWSVRGSGAGSRGLVGGCGVICRATGRRGCGCVP